MQADLPRPQRPTFQSPYTTRPFIPGDERVWLDIHRKTGAYSTLDDRTFSTWFDRNDLHLRQYYVLHQGEPIGTGTAWVAAPLRTEEWGRIHWIAIVPTHQRRGLGSQLMRHLFEVFRSFGCSGAFLTTGSDNEPAISLYEALGFTPWVRSTEEQGFWSARRSGSPNNVLDD